jgi:hypothetical protein
MVVTSVILFAAAFPAQAPASGFEFDFRGGKPLPSELTLVGPNVGAVARLEAEGLRLTLPTDGQATSGWGVGLRFALAGDFEVTGTFELLSIAPPEGGAGAGVAINALPAPDWKKFAKIGRFLRADAGDVYVAETWNKGRPQDYHRQVLPTVSRTGMVRLMRRGSVLHYLAANAAGGEFREIAAWEFGPEDFSMVRFIANNNGSPTPVEARLLNLRVTADAKPLAADQIAVEIQELKPRSPLAWIVGMIAAALLIATGVRVVVRRRGAKRQGVEAKAREA